MDDAEITIKHGPEFRRCLEELDVAGMKRLWQHVAPHLARQTDSATLYTMHLARTQMASLPIKWKMYSQRWLNERGYGSLMNDDKRERNPIKELMNGTAL